MSNDSIMKKLEELMQGLQSHYSMFTDEPSRIEIDLFKEKLRKFYDLVCELDPEVREKREVERGSAEGHPAEGGENKEMRDEKREMREVERGKAEGHPAEGGEIRELKDESGVMQDVEVQSAEQGMQKEDMIEEDISKIENRKSKIENGATLADKFMNAADRTLAAKIKKQHIQDLKTAIGLNDKFNFIKELFNNDVLKYNETVDQLNQAGSREKAESHLAALKEKYQWADELEPYLKFSEYVDKKYF